MFDTEIKTWCIADEGVEVWSTYMSGTHMVCMYGKILALGYKASLHVL